MISGERKIGITVHIWANSKADFEEIVKDLEKEFIQVVRNYRRGTVHHFSKEKAKT